MTMGGGGGRGNGERRSQEGQREASGKQSKRAEFLIPSVTNMSLNCRKEGERREGCFIGNRNWEAKTRMKGGECESSGTCYSTSGLPRASGCSWETREATDFYPLSRVPGLGFKARGWSKMKQQIPGLLMGMKRSPSFYETRITA